MADQPYNEEVARISGIVKPHMTVDANGNIDLPKDVFEKTLEGSDLTLDDFKKTQDYRDNYVAGVAAAMGETGLDHFKKNKKAESVNVETRIHKDDVGGIMHRSREHIIPKSKANPDGGTKTTHGAIAMSYKANGAAGSKGQLKKVKQHIAAMAEDAIA